VRPSIRLPRAIQPVVLLADRCTLLAPLAREGFVLWLPEEPAGVSWRPLAGRAVADVWADGARRAATIAALRRDAVPILAEDWAGS